MRPRDIQTSFSSSRARTRQELQAGGLKVPAKRPCVEECCRRCAVHSSALFGQLLCSLTAVSRPDGLSPESCWCLPVGACCTSGPAASCWSTATSLQPLELQQAPGDQGCPGGSFAKNPGVPLLVLAWQRPTCFGLWPIEQIRSPGAFMGPTPRFVLATSVTTPRQAHYKLWVKRQ